MLSCCVIVCLMRRPRIMLINLHSIIFSTLNSPSLSLVSPSFESDVPSSGPTEGRRRVSGCCRGNLADI